MRGHSIVLKSQMHSILGNMRLHRSSGAMSWEKTPHYSKETTCLLNRFHGVMSRTSSRNLMKKKVGTNIDFLQRQNGSMLHAPEQQRDILSVMMNQNLPIMAGIPTTQEERLMMLARKSPIRGVCTMCMGMSGNGCKIIGMEIITAPQQMEVLGKVALSGFFGVATGTMAPASVGQRFATATTPATATMVSVFAF